MQAIYRTDVFAPQDQLVITTSGSMQRADVFARRERRVAVMTPPEPRRLTSQLAIDGDPIVLTYTSVDHRLPNWTTPVLQSLSARWGSGFGWDSYQAQPTNPQLVVRLLNILSELMQPNYLPPQITPLADGGVQAEWHCNGRDLELVVAADEQRAYYYSDPGSGVEEEAEINANYPHIQALIGGIS
jgi:hypothetical protein